MIVRGTMAIRRQALVPTNTNRRNTINTKWIVDSGASHHLCREQRDFQTLTPLSQKIEVIIGDGSPMIASAKGTIKLSLPCGRGLTIEALLVPRLHTSLLSVGELTKTEPVKFYNECCFLSEKLIGRRREGIFDFLGTVKRPHRSPRLPASRYALAVTSLSPSVPAATVPRVPNDLAMSRSTKPTLQLWHQRLGHLGIGSLKALLKKHAELGEPNAKHPQTEDIPPILASGSGELWHEEQSESIANENEETGQCASCIKTKIRRRIVRMPVERTKQPFELVHSDLCGPITPPSMGGARYFILYIDDFSRVSHVYFLRSKAAEEVVSVFKEFAKHIETQFPGHPIRRFRCDNGKGEYDNHLFRNILRQSGIAFEPSPPYTQHKNGVSERMIGTIATKARAMMIDSNLEDSLWSEAVNTAVYVHALCPSRTLQGKTPHEVLHGKRGDIGHLRRFGCVAYKLIPKELQHGKFSPRATECVMVGYTNSTKIWRLWDPQNSEGGSTSVGNSLGNRQTRSSSSRNPKKGRILNASDVIFDETKIASRPVPTCPQTAILQSLMPYTELGQSLEPDGGEGSMAVQYMNTGKATHTEKQSSPLSSNGGEAGTPKASTEVEQQYSRDPIAVENCISTIDEPVASPGATQQNLRRSQRLGSWKSATAAKASIEQGEPTSYREALSQDDTGKWAEAINAELHSLELNDTWEYVSEQVGMKPIGCKWVFKTKTNPDSSKRYKARLVIKGFEQTDYGDTYAPVAKLVSFRIMIALAAHYRWELDQMDVVTAFLNPPVESNVYMELPEGLHEYHTCTKAVSQDEKHSHESGQGLTMRLESEDALGPGLTSLRPGTICKLRKALYGLKEAPRLWHTHIDTFLKSIGFKQSTSDPNLYILTTPLGGFLFLLLYVDDLLITCRCRDQVNRIKKLLSDNYRMTDLGPARQFLSIQIDRLFSGDIRLSQERFVQTILQRFQMGDCNGVATPMESGIVLQRSQNPDIEDQGDRQLYQSLVGSLMYLMTATRPDLAYTVSTLSKFNSGPTDKHLFAAKRVLRYLKQTGKLGLTYSTGNSRSYEIPQLIGYSDSDHAGDRDDRRSTSGYVFTLQGTAVLWKSNKQTMVTLSSTESEYVGSSEATREGIWLQCLLNDFLDHSSENNSSGDRQSPQDTPAERTTCDILGRPQLLYMDNQSAMKIAMSSASQVNERTKHIDIRFHFVRDAYQQGRIRIEYLPTADMTADILTKALPREAHQRHVRGMGLQSQ